MKEDVDMDNLSPDSTTDPTDRSESAESNEDDGDDDQTEPGNTDLDNDKDSKIPASTRLMRNLAEKQRRDRMNTCIGKLASLVPIVAMATKRIDKSGILRLSASYLRIHYSLLKSVAKSAGWRPSSISYAELGRLLLEAMNGFLLIISESGKIIYVSDGVEKVLGHHVVDVLGQSVYSLIHQDDWSSFQNHLQQSLGRPTASSNGGNPCNFFCCMSVSNRFKAVAANYELVHVMGRVREVHRMGRLLTESKQPDGQKTEKLLVAMVKPAKVQPVLQMSSATCQNEFISTHSLDGRFTYCDHRMSLIAGHLPGEVVGSSAYQFVFSDDIALISLAHRQLLSTDGNCCVTYRMVTRTKNMIFVYTSGVLMKKNSDAHDSLICRNIILTNEDGEKALDSLKARFSPLVLPKVENSALDEEHRSAVNGIPDGASANSPGPPVKIKRKRGRPRKIRPLCDWPSLGLGRVKEESFPGPGCHPHTATASAKVHTQVRAAKVGPVTGPRTPSAEGSSHLDNVAMDLESAVGVEEGEEDDGSSMVTRRVAAVRALGATAKGKRRNVVGPWPPKRLYLRAVTTASHKRV